MKFTTAWAKTSMQNVTLKMATLTLSIVAVAQLLVIISMSLKVPLIIERSCFSKPLLTKPLEPTQEEIKSFLSEALSMRFDSAGYLKVGYLAIEETISREKELGILKSKQMNQRVLISEIKIQGNDIFVLTDRLISIGKVKSVLPLNLKVVIQQTSRSESNPYGLIISSVTQIEDKEEKK